MSLTGMASIIGIIPFYLRASGNTYEGFFVNGKFNGEGVKLDKDGKVLKNGVWKDGELSIKKDILSK